jgi:hypothetical protein
MPMPKVPPIVLACALTACTPVQEPYRFYLSAPPQAAFERLARAFAAQGRPIAAVDPSRSVVETQWEDTGLLYGQIEGSVDAVVVRRYIGSVAHTPIGTEVTVRADERHCARAAYRVEEGQLLGRCEPLTEIPPAHQAQLEALGRRVRAAFGGH